MGIKKLKKVKLFHLKKTQKFAVFTPISRKKMLKNSINAIEIEIHGKKCASSSSVKTFLEIDIVLPTFVHGP